VKRFRGCLMVAFIFFCGLLVGAFLGLAVGWTGFFHKMVKGGPGAVRQAVMERAASDLRLTPEQRARVRAIIDETGTELVTATTEVRPKIEEIMGRGEDRIRDVLEPKQRQKFDRFVGEGRHRWKAAVEARATSVPPPPAAELERPAPASPPQ
jgi:Spy/CpxP family protein refolding chaperone